MITYKKGNLFDAPKGSYLAHACNCMGVWGSGIAAQFREKFPKSYEQYREYCNKLHPKAGDVFVCDAENGYKVICLFTSYDFGSMVDDSRNIVQATYDAVNSLSKNPLYRRLNMPRINSGLFCTPWIKTEEVLNKFPELDITVWSYE